MKIGFLDTYTWDYNIETPYREPLGGTQSAICYLAEALAALGNMDLFNRRERRERREESEGEEREVANYFNWELLSFFSVSSAPSAVK